SRRPAPRASAAPRPAGATDRPAGTGVRGGGPSAPARPRPRRGRCTRTPIPPRELARPRRGATPGERARARTPRAGGSGPWRRRRCSGWPSLVLVLGDPRDPGRLVHRLEPRVLFGSHDDRADLGGL